MGCAYHRCRHRKRKHSPLGAAGISIRQRILVTRLIPENGIALLKKHFAVDLNKHDRDLTQRELLHRLDGAFGVVAMMANRFDRQAISRLGSIERGIIVTNTPGVLTDATADIAFGLLLDASRRISEGERLVRAGKFRGWAPTMLLGRDLTGKTLGIVGAGRIGTAVARRATGFGINIIYFSHSRSSAVEGLGGRFAGLDELLQSSDFISLNVPLNSETKGMIGSREIAKMKRSAILINTARGEIVDERSLIAALKKKRIAAAGLDVYENEPALNPEFLKLDNVVLSPHLGSATVETRANMAEMAALNAIAVLKGERPLAVVNPEVL